MRLWIAEKPDAGRKIAKALGGGKEAGGSIRLAGGDVVTWAIGHLLESFMPEDYDPRFKKWTLEDLPILPDKFRRKPDPGKKAQLNVVVDLIRRASEIVIATDAGREGEAIAWTILDHAGWKGNPKRFWTSSLADAHMRQAVHQLIDDKDKKALYIAARIRSSMDWSDGVNWSRVYNLRICNFGDKVLSLGRVQTATLALVVDRDEAIDRFVPTDYFELKAIMNLPEGRLELFHAPPEDKRITDRRVAEDLARRTVGVPTTLKVEKKPKTFSPPPPFSLPELQMATSARWGWSAKKTLDVAQQLYEAGAVTYPRTDAGHLTNDMEGDMPKHLAALRKHAAFKDLAAIKPIIRKSVFDTKKVDDHHGIIPTDEHVDVRRLGGDAEKLFDLIARRFLAALMPDAKGFTTSIGAVIDGVPFKTSGTTLTEKGWKAVWGGDEEPSQRKEGEEGETNRILPPVRDGQPAKADDVEVLAKTTKPPTHFTEGTLLKAMIGAGAKSDDAEIRDLLSNGGLGTQATRQEIIEKLKYREFVALQGKKIISTPRAREFIAIIREDGNRLADVVATADLERELRQIEKDPSTALAIWKRYSDNLRAEIKTLLSRPARRKLSPAPRGSAPAKRGGGKRFAAKKPSGTGGRSRSGSAPRKAAAGRRRKPSAKRN